MVDSQIWELDSQWILAPSLGHNLCFNYPNGSCEPILDICVLRSFWWYKELFNPMGFDPYNCSLKIREFIKTPTPKVGAHLRVCRFIPSHFFTLLRAWNVTCGLHSWPTPSQALALVTSPRLGLRQLDPYSNFFQIIWTNNNMDIDNWMVALRIA
jgi:hypothetical protein